MMKYVSKIALDIFPSVLATIIGAYIVNHYINSKPAADAAVTAAVSPANPNNADPANATKPGLANLPGPGVKAKGISEKSLTNKSAAESAGEKPAATAETKSADSKPAENKPVETKAVETKSPEKAVESKAAERASFPFDWRRRQPREKAVAKTVSPPVAGPVTAAPATAAPATTAPAVESAAVPAAPEERRDANDLARAAIERLRNMPENSVRVQEVARVPETPRVPEPPRVVDTRTSMASPAPVRPLPPPIMVSTPAVEPSESPVGSIPGNPHYPQSTRAEDSRRLTPPADIPLQTAPPLDLRADNAEQAAPRERTSVADDVLSAAKSMFHAVLPNSSAK
jgi:hypothetical protein